MASKRPSSSKKNETVNFESLGQELGNKPPQAIDVEEAVLGAMLLESECVDLAMEELTPSCFYDPKHACIFIYRLDEIAALPFLFDMVCSCLCLH